jgi:hypothetical protein
VREDDSCDHEFDVPQLTRRRAYNTQAQTMHFGEGLVPVRRWCWCGGPMTMGL